MESEIFGDIASEFIAQLDSQLCQTMPKSKKGGPYPINQKQKRQNEVYKLHFEYGYSARKIAEMMMINRNTINGDLQYWYDAGTYSVTVSAFDDEDNSEFSFDVIVYNTNRVPVMETIPDVTIAAGVTGEFLVTATDPDGDTLAYSIVQQNNPPPYISVVTNSNGTGTVTVSPPENIEPVSQPVTIIVNDNGSPILSDDSTFTLGVATAEMCGMEITSGDAISFGVIDPDEISSEQTITIQNTGNVQGMISMSGSNWTDDNNTIIMNVGTTKYSVTSGNYDSKISLSENSQDVANIMPENNLNLFLHLQSDLIDSLFSGNLTQDIEVNMVC